MCSRGTPQHPKYRGLQSTTGGGRVHLADALSGHLIKKLWVLH
jgi:hypothetical protein